MLRMRVVVLLALVALTGCAGWEPSKPAHHGRKVTVTALAATGADLAPPKTFRFAAPSDNEPLVDDRLRALFAAQLKVKGLTPTAEGGDWVIVSGHSATPMEVTVPGGRKKETVYVEPRDESVTRYVRGLPVTTFKTVPGRWKDLSKELPPTQRQEWLFKASFSIYAASAAPMSSTAALPLWEGSVIHQDRQADILKPAADMIRELAREFPGRSGLPDERESQP